MLLKEFLSLGTLNTLVQIILCHRVFSVHCRIFSRIAGFYPLNTSSTLPIQTTINFSRYRQMTPGAGSGEQFEKYLPIKYHYPKLVDSEMWSMHTLPDWLPDCKHEKLVPESKLTLSLSILFTLLSFFFFFQQQNFFNESSNMWIFILGQALHLFKDQDYG